MDAYDIFKKLTKGLSFKNRVLSSKQREKTSTKSEVTMKTEIKDELNNSDTYLYKGNDGHSSDEESVTETNVAKPNSVVNSLNDEDSSSESDLDDEEMNYDEVKEEIESNDGEELELMKGVVAGEKKKKKEKKIKTEDLKAKLLIEEQNRCRNEHGIRVVGRHVPAALRDFGCLKLRYEVSEATVATIMKCGYTEPTPIQRQAIPCMLESRQILACAPTGSGKTAAFLLPIFHSLGVAQGGPRALILCPTRELAKQIYREALRLSAGTNLRCSIISKVQESRIKERESTVKKSDIVISTPNRLCHLLNQENVDITLDKIKWLIIDEADKMFEGSAELETDFRQQLELILTACSSSSRRVAMFSATITPSIAKWCRHNLRGLINITVGQRNAATSLVEQELLYCGNESGKLVAFRQLVQAGLKPPVLVFVQSKDRAKQLFKELIYDGINVDVIHAGRTQAQRDNVVRSFRVGKIWVLICTELMGRGIDFRGVNLVLNYDFPPSAISYVHRIGRAGRAGQKGKAITYFTQDDIVNLRSIAAVMKQSGCDVPEFMLKMKQNKNKRKKLEKKAPHRDKISTILEKNYKKRKLDDAAEEKTEKKDAVSVKNAKSSKNRKVGKKILKNEKGKKKIVNKKFKK